MILHVIFDDKFGDYVYEQFSKFEPVCKFVLLTYPDEKIKYVTRHRPSDVIRCDSDSYKKLINSLERYRAVVMHGLFSLYQYEIIRNLPSSVKLAWVVWGAEIYSRHDVYFKNLSPISSWLYVLHNRLNSIIGRNKRNKNEVPIDILKRVDFVMEDSEEVFEFTRQYIGNSELKHIVYTYYTLESLIGHSLLDQSAKGMNVMIGNSASLEGNHIDAILLSKRNKAIKNRNVYVPLSYGEPWIKNLINKIGSYIYGKKYFKPINIFLPRASYNEIICSCGAVIMNHHRPNALGNILTALWLGCRVFVSNKNPQTKYLKRIGLQIYTIEDDYLRLGAKAFEPLSTRELNNNRTIISDIYSNRSVNDYVRNVIRVLDS